MDDVSPQGFPYQFKDPRQKELYESLRRLVGQGPADFYRDACKIMDNSEEFLSTTHLVGHLLREIESAIRKVLAPIAGVELEDSHNAAQKEQKHREVVDAILRALNVPPDDPLTSKWYSQVGRSHAFAHRDALHSPRPVAADFQEFWEDMQNVLREVLRKFQGKYLAVFEGLDKLLQKPSPTREDFQKLRNKFPYTPVTRRHFFGKCENPQWLGYLKKEASKVPFIPSEVDYLKRMAARNPQGVRDVIREALKKQIQGAEALLPLMDVINALPIEYKTEFLPRVRGWVPYLALNVLEAEDFGVFALQLAQSGYPKEAQDIVASVLEVLAGLSESADFKDTTSSVSNRAISLECYERFSQKYFPDFTRSVGFDFLKLLCNVLEKMLTQEHKNPVHECSFIWRPRIDEAPQYPTHDFCDALIDDILRTAGILVKEDAASLREILQELESKPWPLFRRIALHLVRVFPEKDLVHAYLANPSLLQDDHMLREYGLLLREQFSSLPPEDQERILSLIGEGPIPEKEQKARVAYWQRDRLYWIRDFLPDTWKERYTEIVTQYGEPEDLESPEFIRTDWGPKSPKSAEEIREMTVEEVIQFLKTWEPSPGKPYEIPPDFEGLGRELRKVVAEKPEEFAEKAHHFKDLDPTYVRALVSGLGEALDAGKSLPWEPVLTLCLQVVQKPREVERRKEFHAFFDADPHWGWTRKEIACLLSAGMSKNLIDFRFRETVWEILCPLTEDPDPSPEDEKDITERARATRPFEIATNSTRGEALKTVFQYALWVHRSLQKERGEELPRTFSLFPEVREILEKHLLGDPTPVIIHSVYGFWFPWIASLDPEWAKEKIPVIFPREESKRRLFEAAFSAYIVYHPYTNVFEILRECYALAVLRMQSLKGASELSHTVEEGLGVHLMNLYGLGKIDLEDSLLSRFFERASPALRKRALEFVGISLREKEEKNDVPPEVLERFRLLWERRIEVAKCNPEEHREELTAFGWWFASGRFDDTWAIRQLLEVLNRVGNVEVPERVLSRLVILADRTPLECVLCLEKIVEGAREGWRIYSSRETIRFLLRKVLESGNSEAVKKAQEVIGFLASRGYTTEFQDLFGSEDS